LPWSHSSRWRWPCSSLRIPARNVNSGEERFYTGARDVNEEVVEARMLLGVHFRTADEDGSEIGGRLFEEVVPLLVRRKKRRDLGAERLVAPTGLGEPEGALRRHGAGG